MKFTRRIGHPRTQVETVLTGKDEDLRKML